MVGHNADLKCAETIRLPTDLTRMYPTLGTAIDYRLRYYFPAGPYEELVAYQGADLVTFGDELSLPPEIVKEFFDSLNTLLHELRPAGRCLAVEQENRLCRYCVVLALFEQVFRAGRHPTSLLFSMKEPSVEALLGLVPEVCVDDLRSQFRDLVTNQSNI